MKLFNRDDAVREALIDLIEQRDRLIEHRDRLIQKLQEEIIALKKLTVISRCAGSNWKDGFEAACELLSREEKAK